MSLQVRLRHALGERWIELPERGVDQPLAVGRASSAEVQVPSVSVGQRHCVLFVHDGYWVVQEIGGLPGTYVNGVKVDGATFLQVGDVITLGTDPNGPAVEIDPAGPAEGRTGYATGHAPMPSGPAVAPYLAAHHPPTMPPAHAPAPPAVYPSNYPVYPPGYAAPAPVPVPVPAPAQWAQYDPAAQGIDPTEAALSAAAASSRYSYPRRRRAADSGAGILVGLLLVLLIAGGTGYWVYQQRQKTTQVAQPGPATRKVNAVVPPSMTGPAEDTSRLPQSIFDHAEARRRAATRPATKASPPGVAVVPPAPPPSTDAGGSAMEDDADPSDPTDPTGPTEMATTQDPADAAPPADDDPAWKQIEAATFSKDEARAILLFDDYARTNPHTATDKLQAYTEKALDRIWFERLEQLAEQREDLTKKIEQADRDMAQESDEAYKKRVLVPLKQQYASRLANIEEELTKNMKYEGKTVPNLLDEAEMDKLRKGRDAQYYAEWKGRVLGHIRRTHGGLPWVTAKSR